MPCIQRLMNRGECRNPRNARERPNLPCQQEYPFLEQTLEEGQPSPQAVIAVGNATFIVRSGDRVLIEELRLFSQSLTGIPRAEVRFTHKLFHCTAQGRLRPWGWQRQPNRIGCTPSPL